MGRATDSHGVFVRPGWVNAVVAGDGEGAASPYRWPGKVEDAIRFHFCHPQSKGLCIPGPDPLLTGAHTGRQTRYCALAAVFPVLSKCLVRRACRQFLRQPERIGR